MGTRKSKKEDGFKERLAGLMEEKGITYEQLGEAIGVGKPSISKWLNGASEPGYKNIQALAAYFNVSSDYLLCLSTIKAKQNIDIEKLGINNDAIEWMQMLYLIANESYNPFNSLAKMWLSALNKLLNISLRPNKIYSYELDFLSNLYKAFECDIEGMLLCDRSFLHDNSAIIQLTEKHILKEGVFCDSKESIESGKQLYLKRFTFSNHDKTATLTISPDDINRFALETLLDLLRDEYRHTKTKEDSFFSNHKKSNREYLKAELIKSIEEANQHDPSMSPTEWFKYLNDKHEKEFEEELHREDSDFMTDEEENHTKEMGDSDGNL